MGWSVKRLAVTVCLLLAVCSAGLSATLGDMVVSNVLSESTCNQPAPFSAFTPSTERVAVYFKVNGMLAGDQIRVEWIEPDGSLGAVSNFDPLAEGGNWCFRSSLKIAGTVVASTPGTWTIKGYLNNVPLFTTSFTISGGGGTAGSLVNGDAETAPPAGVNCNVGAPQIPGWSTDTQVAVCGYGTSTFPSLTGPGPSNRGSNFFAGGPDNALSSITQMVDVSAMTAQIDAGGFGYALSAYLGGFSSQGDNAKVMITFLGAFSSQLGSAEIGPVTAADRGNATGLLLRSTNGTVPVGTRAIQIKVTFTRSSGSYNDGYADNITLILGGSGGGGGGSCPASGTNLLLNPSFEQPGTSSGYREVGVGSNFIPSWNVTSGAVDYIGTAWNGSDGNHSIDLNATVRGAIAQNVSTVAGETYTVCFDMAGNPNGSPATKTMQVSAAGAGMAFSYDSTGRSPTSMGWTAKVWTFTATGNQTALSFGSTIDGSFGPALDNVRLFGKAGTGGGGGTPGCDYLISPTSAFIGGAGGTGLIQVTTGAACAWTAVSNNSWIVIEAGGSGPGTGGAGYRVLPNPTSMQRVGTITIATRTFTITQSAGEPCTFSISPTSANIAAAGGNGSISINASASSCTWSASSNASWITIDGSSSGTGSGTINFTVAANPNPTERNGTMTVAGKTFTVTQRAAGSAGGPTLSGATNAASNIASDLPGGGLAQGSFFSLYGADIGPEQWKQATSFPLPTTGGLGGVVIQVRQGGTVVTCPLHFASKSQVNGIIPSNAPLGNAEMALTFNGQTASLPVKIVKHNFGIFSLQFGRGPGIIQNWISATEVPLNTSSNPANWDQIIVVWGTGLGPITEPDNIAPPAGNLPFNVKITIGGVEAEKLYWGRAPGAAGVDNVYAKVPPSVKEGCNVPVQVEVEGTFSNVVTMSVGQPGLDCTAAGDIPFVDLVDKGGKTGAIVLLKANVFAKIEAENERDIDLLDLSAEIGLGIFVDAKGYNVSGGQDLLSYVPPTGACQALSTSEDISSLLEGVDLGGLGDTELPPGVEEPEYQGLDVGGLAITGPAGPRPFLQLDEETPGVYLGILGGTFTQVPSDFAAITSIFPPPFLGGGQYSLQIQGGADVGPANQSFTLNPPVEWQNRSQFTSISRSRGGEIRWTNGADSQLVGILGISVDENTDTVGGFWCLETGDKGRFMVPPSAMAQMPLASEGAGINDNGAGLGIIVLPIKNWPEFTAPGIDNGMILPGVIDFRTVAVTP